MKWPWVSRDWYEATRLSADTWRERFIAEQKRADGYADQILMMRRNGFEIVDTTTYIEQPPSVDEQDAIVAAKDTQ